MLLFENYLKKILNFNTKYIYIYKKKKLIIKYNIYLFFSWSNFKISQREILLMKRHQVFLIGRLKEDLQLEHQ